MSNSQFQIANLSTLLEKVKKKFRLNLMNNK